MRLCVCKIEMSKKVYTRKDELVCKTKAEEFRLHT